MSLKEKYFKKEGFTAFRLWLFAAALEELSKSADKSKAANLRDCVIEFSESAWMTVRGTAEEKADLQEIIDSLTKLTFE